MATYVFPGQGSQSKGMGNLLFSEFPDYLKKADDILGYSLATLCIENPDDQLTKTAYTQPALFVVNALSYLKKIRESGSKPTHVAGHSLGEYNALFAAEVFDFETGVKLVQKRGSLMGAAKEGGMAAVIGLQADQVQRILTQENLTQLTIANYNSKTQIVISGTKEEIHRAESIFKSNGATLYVILKVSGAFHSPLMNEAKKDFENFLEGFTLLPPKIPVIANLNAMPYESHAVKATLASQINHSVMWTQTIEYLLGKGETVIEEVGPGKVLAGLINRIQKGQ